MCISRDPYTLYYTPHTLHIITVHPHTPLTPQEASIAYPTLPVANHYAKSVQIFPSECRQRAATYRGKLSITVKWLVDGEDTGNTVRFPGFVPIMVKVSPSPCTHTTHTHTCYCAV